MVDNHENGGFNENIMRKYGIFNHTERLSMFELCLTAGIFHCHVWLPESNFEETLQKTGFTKI